MPAYTQTDAKANLLAICRDVLGRRERRYVEDAAGRFLTLDWDEKRLDAPALSISAQRFKQDFSRCCAMVRLGVCFALAMRGESEPVYARRHTGYRDSVDDLVEKWRSLVVRTATERAMRAGVVSEVSDLARQMREDREAAKACLEKLMRGAARLAIGHKPFEEGQLFAAPPRRVVDDEA